MQQQLQCCLYYVSTGACFSSDWGGSDQLVSNRWEGLECIISSGDEIGMLLDLDEGTLSVYKNGRKLGVLKNGLAGPYCWAVSMWLQLLSNGEQYHQIEKIVLRVER